MSNAADLLTAAEVAAEYRVTRMTVSRWVKAGHLAALKLPGGGLRFRRADVEALAQPTGDTAA